MRQGAAHSPLGYVCVHAFEAVRHSGVCLWLSATAAGGHTCVQQGLHTLPLPSASQLCQAVQSVDLSALVVSVSCESFHDSVHLHTAAHSVSLVNVTGLWRKEGCQAAELVSLMPISESTRDGIGMVYQEKYS